MSAHLKMEMMIILLIKKLKVEVKVKWEYRSSHKKMIHITIVIYNIYSEESPSRFVSQRSDIRKNYSALSQKKPKNTKIINL